MDNINLQVKFHCLLPVIIGNNSCLKLLSFYSSLCPQGQGRESLRSQRETSHDENVIRVCAAFIMNLQIIDLLSWLE